MIFSVAKLHNIRRPEGIAVRPLKSLLHLRINIRNHIILILDASVHIGPVHQVIRLCHSQMRAKDIIVAISAVHDRRVVHGYLLKGLFHGWLCLQSFLLSAPRQQRQRHPNPDHF